MTRLDAGPVLAALAAVGGAWVGERAGPGAGSFLVGAVVLAAVAWRWRPAGPAGMLLALGLLAAALMQRALSGLDGPVAGWAGARAEVQLAVRLVEDPRPVVPGVPAGVGVLARVGEGPGAGGLVLVVSGRETGSRLGVLSAGEEVRLAGSLRPLAGREQRERWRHAAAALEAVDLLAARRARDPLSRMANGLRGLVLAGHGGLPDPERALVAGFLVGDDRELPRRVAAEFRAAGLSHLLAVSGANVALALALAAPLLGRLSLAGRFGGGMAVVGVFAAMTRFEPSVLRASAMAALALLAGFLGRPASGVRLLALAVTALVLTDPFLIHSAGFALSCGASGGILVLAGPLARSIPGPSWLRRPLAVTAAAQIGVLPVAVPLFGGVSLVALPANLLAGPAAGAIGLFGLGAGLAGGVVSLWSPDLAVPLGWPAGVLAGWVGHVAAVGARYPVIVSGPVASLLALGLGAALLVGPARPARDP